MMLQIPGVLGQDELSAIRSALDAADWTDGRETVGVQGAQVKRNEQLPDASPLKAELGRIVSAALERNPLFFAAAFPLRVLPPRFNRYQGGGTYGFHVDGSVMQIGRAAGGSLHVRSDVSCTVFLAEPDEYDGGELVIADTYGEHTVKLPAGDMVLYPSSSLHQVNPVTRGARLASFFWVQSMVRSEERRRLLFEMDTSIETLRRSGADAAAVLRLTGVYHNLLRSWAEV
ncbi:Fe2+-dependent dioxygenase [Sinimarinibacterium sp. CAU 1509]|uniref:Fe2+-dependent dioxygenase n=1 Tax=Sinimarinibacterium sp. CAU 1509 TaxID=2562283 RepID=UPI0010AC7F37|nr:Fe2+-dependent dioxygenase [Sinimarinibacterium sp. CAU 1509]TJY56601.1 Fe2+-dependent dioxygenase [Sinimarinibacterium sp. CAU 1509]